MIIRFYVNRKTGDDATAAPDSRVKPWKTEEAAMAACRAAHAAALAADPECRDTFSVVVTSKAA